MRYINKRNKRFGKRFTSKPRKKYKPKNRKIRFTSKPRKTRRRFNKRKFNMMKRYY